MKSSTDRILTSHAGSLPRPDALIEANRLRVSGGIDEAAFQTELTNAVSDVVARQKALGIDLPGDGEFGKAMGSRQKGAYEPNPAAVEAYDRLYALYTQVHDHFGRDHRDIMHTLRALRRQAHDKSEETA